MRLLYIFILIIPMVGCNTQEYTLMFSDKEDKVVFSLIKSINMDQQCFTFSQEEKNSIRKYNLNQGKLIIIKKNGVELGGYAIIDAYTSKIFDTNILLCDLDGKLKFDDAICIESR